MVNVQDNFDFSPAIEAVRPWLDKQYPDFRPLDKKASDFLMERKAFVTALYSIFPQFLSDILQDPSFVKILKDDLKREFPHKATDVLVHAHSFGDLELRQDWRTNRAVRKTDKYVLSRQETCSALKYMKTEQGWSSAAAILNRSLFVYTQNMYRRCQRVYGVPDRSGLKKEPQQMQDVYEALLDINGQADDMKAVTKEFWPILTHFSEGNMTEASLARSLCESFRSKAFQSDQGKADIAYCSFAPVLADISSMVFVQNDAGDIHLMQERRPGAFFYFLYQQGQKLVDAGFQLDSLENLSQPYAL